MERVLSFLERSTFLGCLSKEVLGELVAKGHTKTYPRGNVICSRGEPGDSMMVVLSGRLKITNVTADGREIGLNFLSVGDLVGEIALLDGLSRTADVGALEDSELFVILRRDLLPVLSHHPQVGIEIIKALCEKLRNATSIIEDSTLAMTSRVARGLLRLAQQHGVKAKDQIRIELKFSQTDLGNYLGLSRSSVSRQLTQLRDGELIDFDGRRIVILDEVKLRDVSEFSPATDH